MSNPARPRFGRDILCTFDVREDARDFLADVIESSQAPGETEQLLQQSLVANAQDWQYLIDCAESIRQARGFNHQSLGGQDVLTYVWQVVNGVNSPPASELPWQATDQLIARAKQLERDPEIRPPSTAWPGEQRGSRRQRRLDSAALSSSRPPAEAKGRLTTSHYWSDQPQAERPKESHKWSIPTTGTQLPSTWSQSISTALQSKQCNLSADAAGQSLLLDPIRELDANTSGVKHISAATSPYFTPPASAEEGQKSKKKRPPRGTVSAVPFAPLTSPTFGLIQEVFAHEPFWLLIAVTFLIRTKGLHAIPVFYKFKERFPTPREVADPANTEALVSVIRPLGLSVHRVALMQKYARGFLHDPPRAGKTHKVKNYDRRDFDPMTKHARDMHENPPQTPKEEDTTDDDDLEAWEIGHLTKGKYAIDSWRIFCRDELLGRAADWRGGGREPEFQPEWMRVRPDDKELRACLRWLWMKEGWEWDPASGERTVLREEMQRAVNEGRVEYDDTGGLKILDEPRAG
ncbi:hypothetical protein ACJ41O_002516 [Fusarium nematophilum]